MLEREQVFRALHRGDEEALWRGAASFDWQSTDKTWGTPLIALMADNCDPADLELGRRKMRIAEWCIL